MKNSYKSLFYSFAAICFMAYLFGAFYSTSFNIANWSQPTRGVLCSIAGFLCVMSIVFHGLVDDKNG